ncbi:fam-a protein [Plasmodium vinckei lentum]|uniref:Fam-a protein n=1 Tax=Plasmodium vinckei lentum TaxID=138297 RepID=A0A6V7RXB6_PLAVN|nr:fam-a protein [Plasmodium vinckei lentum]
MNKFYIQIVLFLLSIFVYVNNKAFATELVPKKTSQKVPQKASNKAATPKPIDRCLRQENTSILITYLIIKVLNIGLQEIYEKNKDLLCTDPDETENAEEFMSEAVKQLEIHATDIQSYTFCGTPVLSSRSLYKKKLGNNTEIEKIEYPVCGSNQYNEIINELWDPDHANPFNTGDVKIVRVYNPNLVMIQQRYKKKSGSIHKYFYAFAIKTQISEDTTVIAYASADINDHNPSMKKYQNKIIEKANSFKTDIDSEEDIRKGKLKKAFVNLAGYYIRKYGRYTNITYIESMDGHASIKPKCLLGRCSNNYYINT